MAQPPMAAPSFLQAWDERRTGHAGGLSSPSGAAVQLRRDPDAPELRLGWATSVLARRAEEVASTVVGQRNGALNDAGVRCYRVALAGLLDGQEVTEQLVSAGHRAGLPERECRKTLQSALEGARRLGAADDVPDGLAPARELALPLATVADVVAPAAASAAGDRLQFRTLAELCRDVDGAGPRRWLVRGIWPAGAYGVHAAEPKAGKTWNALDLAVSVASGTPWLAQYPVDSSGPVVVFAGEGGDGNVVRRLRAIAAGRRLQAEALPISVCTRAPHLADEAHLQDMAGHLAAVRPVLVVLDPLYLAAGGADGKDLYAMGRLLERPQHLCEQAGAALVVVTHFNRSRDLRGAARITGAGPAEWGRVLISAAVVSRHTDPDSQVSTVLTELDVQGGEIPDRTLRIRREVVAVDPDNLDSPLTYRVDTPSGTDLPAVDRCRPVAGGGQAAGRVGRTRPAGRRAGPGGVDRGHLRPRAAPPHLLHRAESAA
jgi:hypothetical protein